MKQNIVIAGSGFAGMWAAISAARTLALAGKENDVDVIVVSPQAELHIRPRLYEAPINNMNPDLMPLFEAVGVKHLSGTIDRVDTDERRLAVTNNDGQRHELRYDKFVLATGSKLFCPNIPGLKEHSFNVDQLDNALALDAHLKGLAARPTSLARNTIVVAGGGFTGIETAAEMPARLRAVLGDDAALRVVLVERADTIGPELGAGPRPVIEEALAELGIEVLTGAAIADIDSDGITLSNGKRIESNTVVWTAGARANPLAAQIRGERDLFGRVAVDVYLRAPVSDVYVAGDVARAVTDEFGNVAAMSCQHAMSLGRVAGHNAAAELTGLSLHPYSQPKYVTCLDLGPWGAVYTEGWDRQVHLRGAEAKVLKRDINTKWIYPPAAIREAAFAVAHPDFVIVA